MLFYANLSETYRTNPNKSDDNDGTDSTEGIDDLQEHLSSLIENTARKMTRFSKRSHSLDTGIQTLLPSIAESEGSSLSETGRSRSSTSSQPLLEDAGNSGPKDETELHDVSV